MKKRISALLLSVVLCLGLLGTAAFAAEADRVTIGSDGSVSGTDLESFRVIADGEVIGLFTPDKTTRKLNADDLALIKRLLKDCQSVKTGSGQPIAMQSTSSGGNTGSSGTSGGSSAAASAVTVATAAHGSVTVSPQNAKKGDTVTLTVKPADGYELTGITVKDSAGNALSLTRVSDTEYTFVMPEGAVTVTPVFAEIKAADPAGRFTDVQPGAYYYDAVLWAVEKGITNGTSDTAFSPNLTCTRAQTVTFLWRAAGSPAPQSTANPFTDVQSGAYYYDAVLWAVEQGITNGTSDTAFSPDATVTRGQTVTFLHRYAGSQDAAGSNPFADVAADAYYADAVQWAVANGVTQGTGENTFSPADGCTRGQIVTFLYRYMAD